jgi:DNA-binding FadR family transcriptional regulator
MPQATDGEMARQFGVGKSAIGEAILVLSTKDLVEVTQGSGTRVTDPGKWNVIDSELVSLIVRRGRRKTHEHAAARARILDHLERVAYDRQSRSFLA